MTDNSDDLIIDLTDLMDDEASDKAIPDETQPKGDKTLKLETDTFDLGRVLSLDEPPANNPEEPFNFDKIFKESLNGINSVIKPEPEAPQKIEKAQAESIFDDMPFDSPSDNENMKRSPAVATPFTEIPQPEGKDSSIITETIKNDLPGIAAEVIKPLISELLNEVMSVMKKEMPEIIERIIREEIEKLKKID